MVTLAQRAFKGRTMLRLPVSLSIAAVLSATSASAQNPQTEPAMQADAQVKEVVTLQAFNAEDKTFAAQIHVSADPCPGVEYDAHWTTSGVKDRYAAIDKVRGQVAKIANDMQHLAASCGRRKS
jgi:hypothetical protein